MEPLEALRKLKGDESERLIMFEEFASRISQGESLLEWEAVMFDCLKKMLIKKPKVIVTMSANVTGMSSVGESL